MEITDSVSRGCFISRGKGKKSDISPRLFFGSDRRCRMSESILNDIHTSVNTIHTGAMEQLFKNISSFVERAYLHRQDYSTDIPAAALITGINMTGQFDSVSLLHTTIKSSASPYIAVVNAKNSQDTKAVMKCIGAQLMFGNYAGIHDLSIAENSMESEMQFQPSAAIKPTSTVTMIDIEKWYKCVVEESNERKEIVIIFKDTELFSSSVLQDLIAMISGLVQRLPFVLIFCVAMPWVNVVDRQLPYSSICNLNLTKFYAPSSSELLTVVIDDILLKSNHPFKLGGKSLQLLLDRFLCNDFSLESFLQALKYCILEHFYNEPASILCTNDAKKLNKHVQGMDVEDVTYIQTLPSVQNHLDTLVEKQKESLLKSNKSFREFITKSISELNHFHSCFYFALRSLYSLCKSLPCSDLACSLRQLYCTSYTRPITETVDYKRAMVLLKSCSKQQITARLYAVLSNLEEFDQSQDGANDNSYLQNLVKMRYEIETFLAKLNSDDPTPINDNLPDIQADQPLEKVKYAYQLREELQTRFKQKQMREMTGFQKLREQIIDHLDGFFNDTLKSPSSFVLYESFYYESTSSLRSHVLATPRLAIQMALSKPFRFLSKKCPSTEEDCILEGTPDVCIAYKLHTECGRIINLYDWLEAFHLIITSGQDAEGDSEITEETQARFTRAVSELQFLGLIKPTKRKTDHVERLTW